MKRALLLLLFAGTAASQCEELSLQNANAAPGDGFGHGAELDGDTAMVGVPLTGEVVVFERIGGAWVETQILTSVQHGFALGTGFGAVMSLDGDRLLVGAPGAQVNGLASGAVVAYERNGGLWAEVQTLFPPVSGPYHTFGNDLELDGTRAVIGGSWGFSGGFPGQAYVFEWSAGQWSLTATLQGVGAHNQDMFGDRVDLYGDRIAVSARTQHLGALWASGAVHMFEYVGGAWTPMGAPFVGSATGNHDHFGRDVDLDGDGLLVGAMHESTHRTQDGAAYLFHWDGAAWVEQERWLAPQRDVLSDYFRFGTEVQLHAGRAVVAASAFREAVYLYEDNAGWERKARLRSERGLNGGGAQTLSGDLSLDGHRLLVGEPSYNAVEEGSVVLYSFPPGRVVDCLCSSGPYCHDDEAGCANSTDRGASLSVCGSASVLADDLRLAVWDAPGGSLGLLLMGTGTADRPLGDGRLCVGGSLVRFPVGAASLYGHRDFGPGLLTGQVSSGDTRHFQYWYRDPAGAECSGLQTADGGFNLTNRVSVTFVP